VVEAGPPCIAGMSNPAFNLPKAPIVEAVLDIECDMRPGWDLKALENAARECFQDRYPKARRQLLQLHEIETEANQPPRAVILRRLQALQFLQEDERQLVQVRDQGFSFNRLAPYSSLDEYLSEIERTWNQFVKLASPFQIRLIRLRYINRILLPMLEGRVELGDYLRVAPRLPDEKTLTFSSFLNQHTAVEIESGFHVNIVLTAQAPEGNHLPVIFDNGVAAPEKGEAQNWPWILGKIQALRALKNRIFRNTLTEKCLNLFQ
jgi:uncharacterized protein (TIGR04255 family)